MLSTINTKAVHIANLKGKIWKNYFDEITQVMNEEMLSQQEQTNLSTFIKLFFQFEVT